LNTYHRKLRKTIGDILTARGLYDEAFMLELVKAVDDAIDEPHLFDGKYHNNIPLPAIATAYQDASLKGIDLSSWPEEVVPYVWEVCKLWNLRPPHGAGKKANSPSAQWITGAEYLKDACGEFGVDCIRQVRQDYELVMQCNKGLGPFMVNSPQSLEKSCRAKAGTMRARNIQKIETQFIQPRLEEYWIEHNGIKAKARFDPDNIPAMYKGLIVCKVDEEA